MTTPELVAFIKEQKAKGVPREAISAMLSGQGWTVADIEEGMATAEPAPAPSSLPPVPPAPAAPAMRPAMPSARALSPLSSRHAHGAKLFAAIIAAIVVCLGGAGAYAYYQLVVAPTPSASELISQGMANTLGNISSARFEATTTGTVSGASIAGNPPFSSSFSFEAAGSFSGSVVDGAPYNKLSSDIKAHATFDVGTSTGSLAVDAKAIVIGKDSYLYINDASVSYRSSDPKQAFVQGMVGAVNGFLPSFEGKWILAPAASSTVAQPAFDAADVAAMQSYIKSLGYVRSASVVGSDSIGGVPSYHVAASLQDDGGFASLVRSLMVKREPSLATTPAFEKGMASFKAASEQPISLDLWVGKADGRIHRISLSGISYADASTGAAVSFDTDIELDQQGQPVDIAAPQGAVTMQALIQSMFGGRPL
ncbi:MAG: hypothetical protein KGI69_00580 [Patescibacteria group bacterium]|nr:hypothetical protein [Patescibacteria group bacterium]